VDVIYLFPTGTGKTVVYEASALCSDAASLVVSPLIGLLQQQANRLADRGVAVLTAYNGKVTRFGKGDVRVIYCTPEQTAPNTRLRRYLDVNSIKVERLVVDEAHVVVQWDTFRCRFACSSCECCVHQCCACFSLTVFSCLLPGLLTASLQACVDR
jgi:superfamily II DNA helicase RecQ